jgi:hypothetical protein
MRLGSFVAYGDTISQEDQGSQQYDVAMIGAEVQHFVTGDLLAYAQFALAENVRDGENDDTFIDGNRAEAINRGSAFRLGATYFLGENTAINLDAEYAESDR